MLEYVQQHDMAGTHTDWYRQYVGTATEAIPQISLSPRQALQTALADALARKSAWSFSGLQLDLPWDSTSQIEPYPPLHWEVSFSPAPNAITLDQTQDKRFFPIYAISASTGDILSVNEAHVYIR